MKRAFAAALVVAASTIAMANDAAFRYYFDLAPRSIEELDSIVETLLPEANAPTHTAPLVVVLHGDEAFAFLRSRYSEHRVLVDRTALLDAYGVIDLKMCATWMRLNGVSTDDIPPFIETVPLGSAEIARLRERGDVPAPRMQI